jgi:hypothetical protein
MTRNQFHSALLLFALVCLPGTCVGQAWSGVVAPDRAIDWTRAGATIADRTVQCGSTISAYSGSAATINTAISNCQSGQYIQLGAGTFALTTSISTTKSGVTLRGVGPDQTFLVFSGTSTSCNGLGSVAFCVFNGDTNTYVGNQPNLANWTAGYASGTNSITFGSMAAGSISTLHVGSLLILDQKDDASDPGANIWVCQTSGSNGDCSQQGAGGTAVPGRGQTQQVTVTSISGSGPWTIGISPGLYAPNWASGRSPQAWWSPTLPVSGFGIENLSLDTRSLGDLQAIIEFTNATNCWVKGIRSINSTKNNAAARKHVLVWQATHITVRDSYFYGSSPTSEGYGVDFSSVSADNLAENNIFQHLAAGTLAEVSVGDVFGYNYAVDNYYNNGAPAWQGGDGTHHQVGDYYLLWEGHEGITFNADSIHGSAFFITHFRDYLNGHDTATEVAPKTQSTWAYFLFSGARYFNLVGSVLGTQSYHTHYTTAAAGTASCGNAGVSSLSTIVLGYSDQGGIQFSRACMGTSFDIPNDLNVTATLMRWGNYSACTGDSACNSVRFATEESASTAPIYPGLNSPSQTLPASFYLSSKPSWWGSMPWPAVGPDVTGGNIASVGGHAFHNPAANCYLNIMGGKTDGSSGALTFSTSACYGSNNGGGPDAPKGVKAVVH